MVLLLSPEGLTKISSINCHLPDVPASIDTPMALKRRGVENKIVLAAPSQQEKDTNIIGLIARAAEWWGLMSRGEVSSIRQLAQLVNMDEGDVSRVLPLAFLSPDIVEEILSGQHPADLTSEKLKRQRKLPMSWEEQKKRSGFLRTN